MCASCSRILCMFFIKIIYHCSFDVQLNDFNSVKTSSWLLMLYAANEVMKLDGRADDSGKLWP